MRPVLVANGIGWKASALSLLLTAMGCGDGDGSGAGSGVPSNKPVSEVTDDEAKRVCEWLQEQQASIRPTKEQACTFFLAMVAKTEQECKTLVEQCVNQPDDSEQDPPDDDADCSMARADDLGANCMASVGDVEDCYRDYLALQKDLLEQSSCANAGKQTSDPTPPASCTKLETTCPEVLPGGDGDDGAGSGDGSSSQDAGTGDAGGQANG